MKWSFPLLSCLMVLAFVAAICPHSANARSAGNGNLAGVVVDAHGQPVVHASVTMQTSYGEHPHATFTDASGHFEFCRYGKGQYDLRAWSNGSYSDWLQRIVVRTGRTTQVTLHLKK